MRRITANCERLNQVVINGVDTKPCQPNCSTPAERFQRDHRFIVHLYADNGCSQENQWYLGKLTCWYVNADSAKDVRLCKGFGLTNVLDCVEDAGYAVDNLAVVTGAEFAEDASYADLNLAFTKLYCVMCGVMCSAFGNGGCDRMPAIYFDFKQIGYEASKLLKSFICEYKDGDVRREEIDGGTAWYVHKIPWCPKGFNGNNLAEGTAVLTEGAASAQVAAQELPGTDAGTLTETESAGQEERWS